MECQDSLPSSSHEPFGPGCSLAHCPQHVHLGIQLKRWNTLREELDCKHESLAEMLMNNWYSSQTVKMVDNVEQKGKTSEPGSQSLSDESQSFCQPSRDNDVELKRISRRKARHLKPTKIPSVDELGTVSLAPKRSIIITCGKKNKHKSISVYRDSCDSGNSQQPVQSALDSCSLKDALGLASKDSLQPRVYISKFDRIVSKESVQLDSTCSEKDSVDSLEAASDEDDGNDESVNCVDGEEESDCHGDDDRLKVDANIECADLTERSIEREEDFSQSGYIDEQCLESDAAFLESSPLSSHSGWDSDEDVVSKDSDSDWSPQKGNGVPRRKRQLRRSKRIKTKPATPKPDKTEDGRKTRWQRSKAAASVAKQSADTNVTVSEDVPNSLATEMSRPKLIKLSPSSFQCQVCNARFSSKAEGKQHLLEHQPYKCSFCSGRFKNKHALDTHLTVKHPITRRCNMCFYTCRTKTELRQHVLKQHQVESSPNTTLCHICGQQFKVTINVQKHLAEVHGIVEDSLKKYVCDQCGNEYILKQSFRKHQLTHRGKIIPCNVCSKLFATHDHLRRHYNTVHLKLKKHFCPHEGCDMKFAFRRSLTSHVNMVHLKLRLFPCTWPNCDRRFYAKKHLTVHLRIHNDEKPHKCNICNYACRQRAALNWHMKKHGIYHEPLDDVTKPTYSQFPSNFKRGRKRTRFRKAKPYSMVEDQSLERLVKSEYTSYIQENQKSLTTDQEKGTKPRTQGNLSSQLFMDETKMDYPTMVKPVSKFQLQFGHDEYNQDGSRDQSKSYSDDSSVDCGARNSSSLPGNGEMMSGQNVKPDQGLDSVRDCPTSSFQSLPFAGQSVDLHKYDNPNSFRASTSFQLYPNTHTVTTSKINYDNVHTQLSPSNINGNDHKLNLVHYDGFEKTRPKLQETSHKYQANVMNFPKYEREYSHGDEMNPSSNSAVKYSESLEMIGVRTGGDVFHLSNDFETSQMSRVKSWINQMHMAGFQYPPSQNCFPDDIEHRLVMRKYLNESESDLRHGMNT